jgi:hypothetical protein
MALWLTKTSTDCACAPAANNASGAARTKALEPDQSGLRLNAEGDANGVATAWEGKYLGMAGPCQEIRSACEQACFGRKCNCGNHRLRPPQV